jgi:hypothetical protein
MKRFRPDCVTMCGNTDHENSCTISLSIAILEDLDVLKREKMRFSIAEGRLGAIVMTIRIAMQVGMTLGHFESSIIHPLLCVRDRNNRWASGFGNISGSDKIEEGMQVISAVIP